MKTLFTYLTLIVLFIIGTRLVAAQQEYIRSMQTLVPVEPQTFPFHQYVQLASHSVKETYHNFRPTTDEAVADMENDSQESIESKPLDRKTTGSLKDVLKNRKLALSR